MKISNLVENPDGSLTATIDEKVYYGITENSRFYPEILEHEKMAEENKRKPMPVYQTSRAAKEAVLTFAQSVADNLTGLIVGDEKHVWLEKEDAAKAYTDGVATDEQIEVLDDELTLTGETREELAASILIKAPIYRKAIRKITGLRRKLFAEIDAESDPANYEEILKQGKQQAAQLASQLGLSLE